MRAAVLAFAIMLAACSSDEDESGEAPAFSLAPQPIGYPDIEANDLHGPNCAYASGRSMAPVVIAFGDEAVMKLDGEIRRFTLDPQCREVRNGTGSRYLADDRVLDLAVDGEETQAGAGAETFDGTVRLADVDGNVLYETTGAVQCGK